MHIKIGYYGRKSLINRWNLTIDLIMHYILTEILLRESWCIKNAYEKHKELADVHGDPAVMEVFGEKPFEQMMLKNVIILMINSRSL